MNSSELVEARIMKHWVYERHTYSHNSGIVLKKEDRILSIGIIDGHVCIMEECDGNFGADMTCDEAIEAFQEAIEWIKSGGVSHDNE
jgi:hypothetical protein